MKWILKEKGINALVDQYFEVIEKGENVCADEIIEAGVFLLCSAANSKLFVDKYYLEHGQVNGDGAVPADFGNDNGTDSSKKRTKGHKREIGFPVH